MTMSVRRKITALVTAGLLLFGATACQDDGTTAAQRDKNTAAAQLAGFQQSQPVPVFNYSQLRQNLIEIETAQANSIQTTTFFFNQGVQDPINSCPSVGFPIPSTYQLSNPQQTVAAAHQSSAVISQIEANGVYTADSSGTYVICIDPKGHPYANYWEGFVNAVTGPAQWDTGKHQVLLTGDPTGKFTAKK